MEDYLYYNIKTAGTYTVCPKSCILHAITVNGTANGTITIFDGATEIGVLKANIAEGSYLYDVCLATSLRITTAANSNITISYKAV